MHTKLSYFLLTVILLTSIFIGMTANKNRIIEDDYIQKQQEIKKILDVLLDQIEGYKNHDTLTEVDYDEISRYFIQAKEKTIVQVIELKEPVNARTRLMHRFVNKTNALMLYVSSSIKDNPDVWDEEYFSIVVELIKRMNYSVSMGKINHLKINQVINEIEAMITLL